MKNQTGRTLAWTLFFLLVTLMHASSQEESREPPTGGEETGPTTSIPGEQIEPSMEEVIPDAAGDTSSTIASELAPTKRTLLNLGVTLNESLDVASQSSALESSPSSYQAFSVTRLYGVFQLNRTDRQFKTGIDYKGGGIFHFNSGNQGYSDSQIQQLTVTETVSGSRTKLFLEDSMSIFPGGSFGAQAFGGVGALGTGGVTSGTAGSAFNGFNTFGGLGQGTNITNVTVGLLTEDLTPRSSVTVSGGYAWSAYLGKSDLINYQQISAAIGYVYKLSSLTNISASYGYQDFMYPSIQNGQGSSFNANSLSLGYNRQLTERLSLGLGLGAQFIGSLSSVQTATANAPTRVNNNSIGVTASAFANYSLYRSSLGFTYDHLVSSGSGFYAGATSDVLQFSVSYPIGRSWVTSANAGFTRLDSVGNASAEIVGSSYKYVFAGFAASRPIGPHFRVTGTYQFNDDSLGQSHVALLSFSWRSLPARVD
jgi:hypothetical protein